MTDGGTVHLEHGFRKRTITKLKAKGHRVKVSTGSFGGYQAILYDNEKKVYFGASESRKDGQAAGY